MTRRPPLHFCAGWLLLLAAACGWGLRLAAAIESAGPLTCCGTRGQCPMHRGAPCPPRLACDCGLSAPPATPTAPPALPFAQAPAPAPAALPGARLPAAAWRVRHAARRPAPRGIPRRPPRG